MMDIKGQLLTLLISLLFGIFFGLQVSLSNKIIEKFKIIIKIIFIFTMVFVNTLIYFLLIKKYVDGILHLYGILFIVFGFIIESLTIRIIEKRKH